MAKRIVWMSAKHSPSQEQLAELDRLFPGCQVIIERNTWRDVDEIINAFDAMGGDEMVTVLPLTLVRKLTERGIKPLHAQMVEVRNGGEGVINNTRKSEGFQRHYRFIRFQRLTKFEVRYEDLIPE